ncbi:MAG: hypothetical protein ACOCYD_02635 [bacterium]
MENQKLPRPTQADYDRILQLEDTNNYYDEYMELSDSFDWSAQTFEKNGKYGLKSAVGELLLPAEYDNFKTMGGDILRRGNRVTAQKNGKWGVALANGNETTWHLQPQYDYIGYPNYLTAVCKDGKWGIINMSTREYLIAPDCDMVHTDNGILFVNRLGLYEKNGKIGVVRMDGAFTEAIFEETDFEPEGPIKVMFNGEWGFINEQGSFTTNEEDDVWWFSVE